MYMSIYNMYVYIIIYIFIYPFTNPTCWRPTLVISSNRPRSAVSSMCPPRNRSRSGAEIFSPGPKSRAA